jgi:mono/diheme cytochrome c family protein
MKRLLCAVVVLAVLAAIGFSVSGRLMAAAKGNASKGKALYAKTKCDVCHGKGGRGDGPAAKSLKPPPTNFTDRKYMSTRTDKQLFNATKNGGPAEKKAPTMPAYKDKLKDAEIDDMVAYLRALQKPK